MSCGDSGTNRPLQFRFPASDYVPPVPQEIPDAPTRNYLLDLRKQLTRMFDATRTVTQDIQAPVVLQVNLDANQSLSAATPAKVQFNYVRYDTHGYWSPTNYRFNPRIAGFYRISWSVCFGPDAGGDNLCTAQMKVSGNGDVKAQARNSSTTQNVTAATSTNLYLDGDTDVYIEIWATSVAAVALVNDPGLTFLTVDYAGDIHVGALSGANFVSTDGSIRINTDDDSVYAIGKPGLGRIEVQGYAPTVIRPTSTIILDAPMLTQFDDESPFSRAYALIPTPTFSSTAPTIVGGAGYFPNPTDHFTDTSYATWDESAATVIAAYQDFRIEFDVYFDSGPAYGYADTVLAIGNDSLASTDAYGTITRTYDGPTTGYRFYISHGQSNDFLISDTEILTGQWFNVVLTRTGDQYHLYIDGVLDTASPVTGPTYAWGAASRHTTVGANHHGGWGAAGMDGKVKNVLITRYET